MPRCAGRAGAGIPALSNETGFGCRVQHCQNQTRFLIRAIASRRRLLRDAALADERQPDDVARRLRCFDAAPAHPSHPTPASRTRTRCTAARSAPVRSAAARRGREGRTGTAARAPPPGRSAPIDGCAGALIRGCPDSVRIAEFPFRSARARVTGRKRLLLSHSAARQPSGFQEQCHRMAERLRRLNAREVSTPYEADCWRVYVARHTAVGNGWATYGRGGIGQPSRMSARRTNATLAGPFTKPTHEVGKPFAPEGDVDPHAVALRRPATTAGRAGCRTASGTRSGRAAMRALRRVARRPASISLGIVRRDRRIGARRRAAARAAGRTTASHVGLLLVRHRRRLLVGALHQPHARAQLVHPPRRRARCDTGTPAAPRRGCGTPAPTASRRSRASARCRASSPCRCGRRTRGAPAGSRMRRRLSTQVARSTSTPSCVSFSEMFRSMPDGDDDRPSAGRTRAWRPPPPRASCTLSPR